MFPHPQLTSGGVGGDSGQRPDEPYQAFRVQEGRSPAPGCGPFGEVDDVVQVPGQIADVLLLFSEDTLVVLCYSLEDGN